ncbi:hypothetical protein Tco_0257217 [Tanacetum coccineum]
MKGNRTTTTSSNYRSNRISLANRMSRDQKHKDPLALHAMSTEPLARTVLRRTITSSGGHLGHSSLVRSQILTSRAVDHMIDSLTVQSE